MLNTQDYLIAQGAGKLPPGQLPRTALKYSFSQDGVKWIDLEALSDEVVSKAATITGMLSGEPAKSYTIQEPGAPPAAEGEVRLAMLTCTPSLHTYSWRWAKIGLISTGVSDVPSDTTNASDVLSVHSCNCRL